MDHDESVLEDGEISDDSDTHYTPLERPKNYSTTQPYSRFSKVVDSESENDLVQSSDDDSDSDSDPNKSRNKKQKFKIKPIPAPLQTKPKTKKYDIWSTRVQEDVLSETLNSCDVTKKDRSRDVESYDYTQSNQYHDMKRSKRSRDDRKNPNIRCNQREWDQNKACSSPRNILELTVDADASLEDTAKDIANKLCEEKEDLILNVIKVLGKEKCIQFFKETKQIENEGGMLIMNQTRRRTPGGVFLFLIRHDSDLSEDDKRKIFNEEKQKNKAIVKAQARQKCRKIKMEVAQSRDKLLPDLLTRAELLAANDENRTRKDTDDRVVINPPPTPETDQHENSGDGMDGAVGNTNTNNTNNSNRKMHTYDEDFLDLNGLNEMDLF